MDIEPIKLYLSRQPRSLDDVYAEFQQTWQELQWQSCQVRLLLSVLPDIERKESEAGECFTVVASGEKTLQQAIIEIVRDAAPQPLKADLIQRQLQATYQTSPQQIITIAKTLSQLTVIGGIAIRYNG